VVKWVEIVNHYNTYKNTIMLTGDNQRVASYVGKKLKIDKVIAEVLPQDPSLAKADLGIAIGAGTDIAIETPDVILVRSNPLDVVNILKLYKSTYKKITQNLIWATVYNVIALPLAAGILYNQGVGISPTLGAVLMSLSTVIVSINAKFLKND